MNLFDEPRFENAAFPTPRPFQETAHAQMRSAALEHRCQMIMAPTGSGKTYLGLRVCHEALKRGKRAVFVCDRTALINQTSQRADEYGLAHSVMQAEHWRFDPEQPFQICSAQTIARREWPDADVIVVDEAHTQLKAWTTHVPDCRARVIGLSATPFSRGLGKLFSNLINATTAHALTESGVLVPMRVFTCTPANMEGAETKGGEWTPEACAKRGSEIVGDVVTEWLEHAQGRKTIVFGATIAHCEEIARQFNDAGIQSAVFCAHTTPEQRAVLLDEYRKPDSKLRVLASVEALAKGFDVPDVGCVVDCRPLRKSLSTAMQMWGRGLRSSPDTGKSDTILLDHTGNILRFAKDYEDIFYNGLGALDSGEKLDKKVRTKEDEEEAKKCPKCGATPFHGHCVACGYEAQKKSEVVAIAGHAHEIQLGHGHAQIAESIYAQLCTYARQHSRPETQAGRAAHLYKDITGSWPPREWAFDATPNVPMTKPVLNLIRAANIRFAKRRAA